MRETLKFCLSQIISIQNHRIFLSFNMLDFIPLLHLDIVPRLWTEFSWLIFWISKNLTGSLFAWNTYTHFEELHVYVPCIMYIFINVSGYLRHFSQLTNASSVSRQWEELDNHPYICCANKYEVADTSCPLLTGPAQGWLMGMLCFFIVILIGPHKNLEEKCVLFKGGIRSNLTMASQLWEDSTQLSCLHPTVG